MVARYNASVIGGENENQKVRNVTVLRLAAIPAVDVDCETIFAKLLREPVVEVAPPAIFHLLRILVERHR